MMYKIYWKLFARQFLHPQEVQVAVSLSSSSLIFRFFDGMVMGVAERECV